MIRSTGRRQDSYQTRETQLADASCSCFDMPELQKGFACKSDILVTGRFGYLHHTCQRSIISSEYNFTDISVRLPRIMKFQYIQAILQGSNYPTNGMLVNGDYQK